MDKFIMKASVVVERTQDSLDTLAYMTDDLTNKLKDILDDSTHPPRQQEFDGRLIQRS